MTVFTHPIRVRAVLAALTGALALVLALAGCSSSGGGGGGGSASESLGYLVVLTAESEGEGTSALWVHEIGEDGSLDLLDGSPLEPGFVFPTSLLLHPSQPVLIAGDEDESGLYAFGMGSNGTVEELSASPSDVELTLCQIVLSHDGDSLFASRDGGDPYIFEMFDLNTATGDLTSLGISDDIGGECPGGIAAHPSRNVLYVSEEPEAVLQAWSYDDEGNVSAFGDEQVVNDAAEPRGIAITPDGKFLYVLDTGNGTALVVGKVLNANGTFATDADEESVTLDPKVLTIHPDSTFLYVASFNTDTDVASDDELAIFSINASTGALTPISGSPFSMLDGVGAMTFSPDGDYLFMANTLAGTVQVFSVNASTGALTEISGSPFDGGVIPFALQVVQP